MSEENRLAELLKKNPGIDQTALDRSLQAAEQLADIGIKLGGYRLSPALGGGIFKDCDQTRRRGRDA